MTYENKHFRKIQKYGDSRYVNIPKNINAENRKKSHAIISENEDGTFNVKLVNIGE